jgi:hypothetical protein
MADGWTYKIMISQQQSCWSSTAAVVEMPEKEHAMQD